MLASPSHIHRNLRNAFRSASVRERREGLAWYRKARREAEALAAKYGEPAVLVVWLIASLSPKSSWSRNLKDAEHYLQTGIYPGMKPVSGGRKVGAFFHSIFRGGRTESVCVDRHIASAAAGRKLSERELKRFFDSPRRKDRIEKAIRTIAKEEGLWPAQVQAIIWVWWKG